MPNLLEAIYFLLINDADKGQLAIETLSDMCEQEPKYF